MKRYCKTIALKAFSILPQCLKIPIYRMRGARIAGNVRLGFGSVIIPYDRDFSKILIEEDVVIEDNVRILAKNIHLKKGAQIKEDTKIWGQSDFMMGVGAYIDQRCLLDLRRDVSLGDKAGVGAASFLYTHGVWHSILSGAPTQYGPIIIKDRAWVAANVFIMPNVTIGEDSIVGARSVVTKNVDSGSVVCGNPAKEITKTNQITKNLSASDKTKIVSDLLMDYLRVFDEKTKLVESKDLVIDDDGTKILLKEKITQDDAQKLVKENKDLVVLSFNTPENAVQILDASQVSWIDLEKSTRSNNLSKKAKTLESFLGDYGIQLKRAGD